MDPAFPRRLRELREGAGLSLRALAAAALSSKSHVHEFETGAAVPTRETLALLDRALDAGGELEAMVVSLEQRQEDPTLVATLTLNGQAGVATVAPEPWSLVEMIARPSMPLSMVERMERLALAQIERYPHTPPQRMWPIVMRELARVREALHQRQALSVQLRLTRVAGMLAGVAGHLSTDVGRHSAAIEYLDLSQLAGRESGDPDLTAWAMALESIDWFFNREVEYAVALLDKAAALGAQRSSARRQAWISAMRAQAYASKRDAANAQAALERAMVLMQNADPPTASDFFDQDRLGGIAGTTHLLLGHTDRAQELIHESLVRRSASDAKGRARLMLDSAACWVQADERECAYGAINTALDLAEGQFVRPIAVRIREVIREMNRWPETAASRSIFERLSDLDG
jgi:transcriptional regulator with XRE-family HTH domain